MLHHAARRAELAWTPLSSILHAAASRAWTRTSPARALHRSMPARHAAAVSATELRGGESSKGRSARWEAQLRDSVAAARHAKGDSEDSDARERIRSHCEELLEPVEHMSPDALRGAQDTYTLSQVTAAEIRATLSWKGKTSSFRSLNTSEHNTTEVFDSYEDDPPWDEAIESMRDAGDPLPCVSGPATPSPPVELRRPTSAEELYQSMIYLSKPSVTGDTRPLQYLQRLHDAYPKLQSTQTYNFLLSLAIGSGELDTAARLLHGMSNREVEENLETRVLRVRLMIRRGLWVEAWAGQTASGPLPLPVWLEFFGTIKYDGKRVMDDDALQEHLSNRGPLRPRQEDCSLHPVSAPTAVSSLQASVAARSASQPPSHDAPLESASGAMNASQSGHRGSDMNDEGPSPAAVSAAGGSVAPAMTSARRGTDELWFGRQRAEDDVWQAPERPSLSTELARYDILMRHFPPLTAAETACMPPRVVQTLVEWFVRTGNRTAALDTTKSYFESLPRTLSPRQHAACLKIIHPQLVPVKETLSGHFKARKTLRTLLALHPDLQPTATTLVYLLNSLRTTAHCGTRAAALAAQFTRTYGEHVVDERVRWRLAWLALKQRQLPLARRVFAEHARSTAEAALQREFAVGGACAQLPRGRPRFEEVFAARGVERYWAPLRARLGRLEAREKEAPRAR